MALTFGGATSDRVNCGSAAVLDNMTAITVLVWVYPTTLSDRVIITKSRGSVSAGWTFGLKIATGFLEHVWYRATTPLQYVSNSNGLTTNSWQFVALSSNQTGPAVAMYVGNLTTAAVAATFGITIAGVGTFNSDAARSLFVGNIDAVAPALAFQGNIAVAAVVNRAMTQAEIQAWQFRPRIVPGTVGFWQLNGTGTQPDLSGNGNNGTVTGATQADHVPLGAFFS